MEKWFLPSNFSGNCSINLQENSWGRWTKTFVSKLKSGITPAVWEWCHLRNKDATTKVALLREPKRFYWGKARFANNNSVQHKTDKKVNKKRLFGKKRKNREYCAALQNKSWNRLRPNIFKIFNDLWTRCAKKTWFRYSKKQKKYRTIYQKLCFPKLSREQPQNLFLAQ